MIADFLWLSDGEFLHYWIAISLTLIVLDFFINTELLSWVAMLIFAAWATACVDPAGVWSVLVFLLFLAVAIAFYIFVIKKLTKMLASAAAKNAPAEVNETLAGQTGKVLGVGENLSVKVDGVVYPLASDGHISAGDTIVVKELRNGIIYPRK